MVEELFSFLRFFENTFWSYLGVPAIFLLGVFLSVRARFFQIIYFPKVLKSFIGIFNLSESTEEGVHPLKAFFACIGSCLGVGNVVGICTAIQIGGPGALFWIWVTGILGMVVKYAEVYLGIKYRVSNGKGGYNGGPMYFLGKLTNKSWVLTMVGFLLTIYGVEVYQFSVITESLSSNFEINRMLISGLLLIAVLLAVSGGLNRVGSIAQVVIPLFFLVYLTMGLWVIFNNYALLPSIFSQVISAAFTGHAAIGGTIGGSIIIAISQGVRRGCYTSDLGIGSASVIHSESSSHVPEKQASLVIFDVFIDTFLICTTSVLLILVTDTWHEPKDAVMLVQMALGTHFPYMEYFMPFFLLILGYSSITAYFCVGLKASDYVSPKYGRAFYYVYTLLALIACSFVGTSEAQTMMAIAGGMLLVINCWGIYKLRDEISYDLSSLDKKDSLVLSSVS